MYDGDPDAFAVTEDDIAGLIATVNEGYPTAALTRDDVVHFYGGLRPLVESAPGDDPYSASRRSEIVDHGESGGPRGLLSALGGKWTTARAVAEQVVDRVQAVLGARGEPCRTHTTPLPGGRIGPWKAFVEERCRRHRGLEPDVVEHLAVNYGARMDDVLALAEQDAQLGEPLAPGRVERRAEVVYAVRNEMALELGDVVFRRTGLCTLGDPGDDALDAAAALMGAELGWADDDRVRQVEAVRARLTARPGSS